MYSKRTKVQILIFWLANRDHRLPGIPIKLRFKYCRILKRKLWVVKLGIVFACCIKNINMDKIEKMHMMDKMVRELEDVKNSETSLLKKIAQLEADNINLGK